MSEYMMIMKSNESEGDWNNYIARLVETGMFRGGSAFGNGRCLNIGRDDEMCSATGYMRFEANSIDEIQLLLAGNPTYEAGGSVEIHELVVS